MIARLLADAVLLLHLGFILFVLSGALVGGAPPTPVAAASGCGSLGRRDRDQRRRVAAYLAGNLAAVRGRRESGYGGGSIEHYILALIYAHGLGRNVLVWLALAVVTLNVGLYGLSLGRRRRQRTHVSLHQRVATASKPGPASLALAKFGVDVAVLSMRQSRTLYGGFQGATLYVRRAGTLHNYS